MKKLEALKESDPAAFKKVANRVAEHFGQLAGLTTGAESEGLSRLASRFASASENGDLSAVMPHRSGQARSARDCSGSGNVSVAPPAPPPPMDAAAMALSFVSSLTSSSSTDASSSDPVDQLSALKASSPAKFKNVMDTVANQLEALGNVTGGADGEALSKLAATFANASQNGDMTAINALKPPPPPVVVPPAPPPPAAPEPIDARATASALVDSMTASSGATGNAYEKLTALKTTDQASFKKVMNGVAEQLEALGNLAEGSDGESLRGLAASFASGSQNGDISMLKPASIAPPAAPPPPPPPAAPEPVDAMATASTLVDALTGSSASGSTFDKLTALKASSQPQFKQVMDQVAGQLEALGNLAEGGDREALLGLAASFASSGQSGDLSALKPAAAEPEPETAPVPPAAPPAAPPPVDAMATAFSMVDALTSSVGSDPSASALQKLTTLKTTDQPQFKSVMNQVAQQLESLGNLSEGSDGESLLSLARTFASGGQNGDLSALQPAPAPAAPTPPAAEPPPAAPGGWKWGQANAAYRRQAPSQAFQDAFSSALSLVDSLTTPAAA
jgi:hypothetical protein